MPPMPASDAQHEPLRISRPAGRPIMKQTWGSLLFMHWPIDADALRPLLPEGVKIDLHGAAAWIGVVPFTMWGVRLTGCPAIPGLSAFHELNVRTYVRAGEERGVWFFSLDAAKRLPVRVARAVYSLPYFFARMRLDRRDDTILYESRREDPEGPMAHCICEWRIGDPLPPAEPGSIDSFLTDRDRLFTTDRHGELVRARIHHPPWPLRSAEMRRLESTMVSCLGPPEPAGEPLLHYSERLDVDIWRPEHVESTPARGSEP